MKQGPYTYPDGLTPIEPRESIANAQRDVDRQRVDDLYADFAGDLGAFPSLVLTYKLEEARVLCSKQRDYGAGNIGNCPAGPITGLVVRMFDKLSRLANLERTGRLDLADNEAAVDTTGDLANYGTIGSMVLDGVWPEA